MAESAAHHHHSHDHHHHHEVSIEQASSKAFLLGIALNLIYVVVELVYGLFAHSLSLISDAGHNFGDVIGLALSLLALRLAKVKPNEAFTYGYKKTTILAALINATILLIAIGILGYESVIRLQHPAPVQGGTVAIIAGIGIIINSVSAYLFSKNHKHELNARSAYLHLMADAMVSIGVVITGIIIKFTGWYWLDPTVSLIVLIIILFSTWSLLTNSLRLSLDAVPKDIVIADVEQIILKVSGVENVHHIHVWAMSTTENALTAHIMLNNNLSTEEKGNIVKKIKHDLVHYNIQHATIEVEFNNKAEAVSCATA